MMFLILGRASAGHLEQPEAALRCWSFRGADVSKLSLHAQGIYFTIVFPTKSTEHKMEVSD